MFYKKKKSFIYFFISFILYTFLTIFIIMGLFNLFNFTYEELYKEKLETPTDIFSLELKPMEMPEILSNNIIEEKIKEEEIPVPKDPKIIEAMKVIENYYKSAINKNIKSHFSANNNNMCKMIFKVNKSELTIVSCDDFAFKRQVELSLSNVKPYPNKTVNGVDLSKEMVYFDYLISDIK